MGVADKIKEIEEEMNRTQKNKATEHHLGRLKAQLAKLRRELLEDGAKGGPAGEGFAVQKFGNARVSLVGFPSVGKSSMLSKLTETQSKVHEGEFTTLTCVPGVLYYNNCKIQLLDLPGIIEGAAHGKGNGRQVLAVAKASDLLLIVLEPSYGVEQRRSILRELDAMGIRINRRPPDVTYRYTKTGGVKLTSTCKLTRVTKIYEIDEQTCKIILNEYKVHNCELIVREDISADDLIDVIEGNRKYVEALFVYNKIDTISMEDVDELARRPNSLVISVNMGIGLDYLLEKIWEKLELVRVYTKKKGDHPDFDDPIILTKGRKGCTITSICNTIHKDFIQEFKYALVWGRSAKFSPQNCDHELMDEDVLQIFASHKQRQERIETGKIKAMANNINAKNKTKGKGEKKKKK